MGHPDRRTKVTPLVYEEMVAAHFRRQGYSVELTPHCNDYGVDAFACKENQKLALQAKMYGGGRKVNRAMVMQLHGAKDYFGCTEAVIVTNGEVDNPPTVNPVPTRLIVPELLGSTSAWVLVGSFAV